MIPAKSRSPLGEINEYRCGRCGVKAWIHRHGGFNPPCHCGVAYTLIVPDASACVGGPVITQAKGPESAVWMQRMAEHASGDKKAVLEMFWILTANVSGGDWTAQSPEWQQAAERCRLAYVTTLDTLNHTPAGDVL